MSTHKHPTEFCLDEDAAAAVLMNAYGPHKAATNESGFTDQSTGRDDLDKMKRFLRALSEPRGREANRYFFDDGFPRWDAIEADARASRKVLDNLTNGQ